MQFWKCAVVFICGLRTIMYILGRKYPPRKARTLKSVANTCAAIVIVSLLIRYKVKKLIQEIMYTMRLKVTHLASL